MASKITRSGILQTETAQYHPGTGRTQCPKCDKIIGSASLTCKHCNYTRTPASKKDQYILKTNKTAIEKTELARLRLELDRAHKTLARKEKELSKAKSILGWISSKANQHS